MFEEFKVVVMGDARVGKTALSIRLAQDTFVEDYDPTIEDRYVKHLEVDSKMYRFVITDIGADQTFNFFRESYLREADGVLIVFSVNSFDSFKYISDCLAMIEWCRSGLPQIPYVFVGNKADLKICQELVCCLEAGLLTNRSGVDYIETSAKNSARGIRQALLYLARKMISDKASPDKVEEVLHGRRRSRARSLHRRMRLGCKLL